MLDDDFGRGELITINKDNKYIEFHDEYEHHDDYNDKNSSENTSIEYILESIIMPPPKNPTEHQLKSYEKLISLNNSIYSDCHCDCKLNSCINNEICSHGGNYRLQINEETKRNELILNKNRLSNDLIYECTELCKCLPKLMCTNRLVQFGPRKQLKICKSINLSLAFGEGIKQLGLITLESLQIGTFVCEYAGEIITKDEANKRHEKYKKTLINSCNYIICLNEYSTKSNIDSQPIQTFIDPTCKGNIGRYLNHSCDPNCDIISVRIDGPIPKLAIFTNRKVLMGEELCFDYGSGLRKQPEYEKYAQSTDVMKNPCYCGTTKCRKFLPNYSYE